MEEGAEQDATLVEASGTGQGELEEYLRNVPGDLSVLLPRLIEYGVVNVTMLRAIPTLSEHLFDDFVASVGLNRMQLGLLLSAIESE